jgi:DNA repair protein RadA/Sms
MPKFKTMYVCNNCGYTTSQWVGQCSECKQWNTFVEDIAMDGIKGASSKSKIQFDPAKVVELSKVSTKPVQRLSSNIEEFDRVLGGGFVPGQVILLAGDPGVGKSTLLTQICMKLSKDKKILYVCGEESVDQVKVRTSRMGYKGENLFLISETNVETISQAFESMEDLALVIVDSIQTSYSSEIAGMSGSISQIKGSTQLLTEVAKKTGIPVVLVGHVTKEGTVAGPKILEHIVDTVLQLEGDSQHMYRLLRTSKNRFGPVSEVGIFEMKESGMEEVANPSQMFLEQRLEKSSGSCVTVVMEGYRPLLFEVQALTTKTSFGYPRRTTSGFNNNRLLVLLAILEKRCGLNLSQYDVYVSVAGGFKISEYSADLAVCLAVASSLKDVPVKADTVVFGECGLNGEVRKVSHMEKRAKEANKLGYSNVVGPEKMRSINDAIKSALGNSTKK